MVLSIKPKLTIWAPLGVLTQKRTVPVVEIDPLKMAPVGNIMGNCADDAERVIVGRVVADAKRVMKDSIIRVVIAILVSILIFFHFPTRQMPREEKTDLNNNLDVKEKK